jgi:hypothetical protein
MLHEVTEEDERQLLQLGMPFSDYKTTNHPYTDHQNDTELEPVDQLQPHFKGTP